MVFRPLARFTIRPREDGLGDLILSTSFKSQNLDLLKPGIIYEIREILGELTIVPVGDAAISMSRKDSMLPVSWSNDVNWILNCAGGAHLLTKSEIEPDLVSEDKEI